MYFALIYETVEDYLERRGAYRAEHLELAREASRRGELVFGGAFTDPPDAALLVFEGADRSVAERFAAADPYVQNGLVKSWRIREWNVVVGRALGNA